MSKKAPTEVNGISHAISVHPNVLAVNCQLGRLPENGW